VGRITFGQEVLVDQWGADPPLYFWEWCLARDRLPVGIPETWGQPRRTASIHPTISLSNSIWGRPTSIVDDWSQVANPKESGPHWCHPDRGSML